MFSISENNKRIAKNTLMLYIRMFLNMGVSLFTSRVVLQQLGVEDFGIYNVVGGVVVLFSLINAAMVSSTQRFLNYELGRGDEEEGNHVFSSCLVIHVLIALIVLLLAETSGLWFLNTYIQYPENRHTAVMVVYQCSIFTTCVNIIRSPYNAAMVAYEHMSIFAYFSIIENILKLLIVYVLSIVLFDKLIVYSFLMFLVVVLITLFYYIYCKCKFSICKFCFYYNKNLYHHLIGFSGWSLLGAVANVGVSQGLNILLNMFYGVTVNAAVGVANQINTAVYHFVSNFQTSFNPTIVKSYAKGEKGYFVSFIQSTSKYSFFLLFVISTPVYICCGEVLSIWLTEVPEYTVSFCRLMIVFSLMDSVQGPLWVSIQATGNIKKYQLVISILMLSNLPISYILLSQGFSPLVVLLVKCFVNVVVFFFRIFYMRNSFKFPIKEFLYNVVSRIIIITSCSFLILSVLPLIEGSAIIRLIEICVISIILNIVLIYFIGLTKKEKLFVHQIFRKVL